MSAREEQPATVPPPAGEDDAYNAATKVGAMPAEVMARLRAEGLLPEEGEEGTQGSSPATTKPPVPAPRPTPQPGYGFSSAPPVNSSAPPTPRVLASGAPEAYDPLPILDDDHLGETGLPQIHLETPLNEMRSDPERALAAASSRPPIPVLGSRPPTPVMSNPPIGFPSAPPHSGYPTALQGPAISNAPPPPVSEPGLQQEIRAFGGTRLSKAQRVVVLVAALGLVVAFAFLMALLSQRR